MSAEQAAQRRTHPFSVAEKHTGPSGEVSYALAINGRRTDRQVPHLVGETLLAFPVGAAEEAAGYEHFERILFPQMPQEQRKRVFVSQLITQAREVSSSYGLDIRTREGQPRRGSHRAISYGFYIDRNDVPLRASDLSPTDPLERPKHDGDPLVDFIDGKRVLYVDKREDATIVDIVVDGHVRSKSFVNYERANEKTMVDYIFENGVDLSSRALSDDARMPGSTAAELGNHFKVLREKLAKFAEDPASLFLTHGKHPLQTYSLNAIVIPRHESYLPLEFVSTEEPNPQKPTYYVQVGEYRTEVVVVKDGAFNSWIFNNRPERYDKDIADYYFMHHNTHTSVLQMDAALLKGGAPADAINATARVKVREHLRKMNGGTHIFDSISRKERSTHRLAANVIFGPPPDEVPAVAPAAPEQAETPELVETIDGKRVFYIERTAEATTIKIRSGNTIKFARYVDEESIKAKTIVDYMLDNPHFIDMVELPDIAAIPGLSAEVYDHISRMRKSLDTLTPAIEPLFTKEGNTQVKSYKMNAVVVDLGASPGQSEESTPAPELNPDWPTYYVRKRGEATYVTVVTNGTAETKKFVNTEGARRRDVADYILAHPGIALTKSGVEEAVGLGERNEGEPYRQLVQNIRRELAVLTTDRSFDITSAGANSTFSFFANVVSGRPPAELFFNAAPVVDGPADALTDSEADTQEIKERKGPRPVLYVQKDDTSISVSKVDAGRLITRTFTDTEYSNRRRMVEFIVAHPREPLTLQMVLAAAGNPDPAKRFDSQLSDVKSRLATMSTEGDVFSTDRRSIHSSFILEADVVSGPPPEAQLRFQTPDGTIMTTTSKDLGKLLTILSEGPLARRDLLIKMNVLVARFNQAVRDAAELTTDQPVKIQITPGRPNSYALVDSTTGTPVSLTRLEDIFDESDLFTTKLVPGWTDTSVRTVFDAENPVRRPLIGIFPGPEAQKEHPRWTREQDQEVAYLLEGLAAAGDSVSSHLEIARMMWPDEQITELSGRQLTNVIRAVNKARYHIRNRKHAGVIRTEIGGYRLGSPVEENVIFTPEK